jgi:hypothetical protein
VTDKCEVPKKRKRRPVPRDMSWFPECGFDRVRIEFDENPAIVATAYGNLLVEANLDCNTPFLFRREGSQISLIYVGRDPVDRHVVIKPLAPAVLKSMLHEVADYGRMVRSKEGDYWKSISPYSRDGWPTGVLEMLMTNLATDPDIPVLKMLVTSPVLTKDGWLEETAFAPESGILSRLGPEWRPLDLLGLQDMTVAAKSMVRDMFSSTKLSDDASVSMLVGSMVSIVARPLFKNVPLIVHASGDFGTGKTTTASVIGQVCLSPGEWTVVSCADFDGSAAEMDKRVADALTGLHRYIVLDDPREGVQFNNGDLATLLTTPYADIRTFGKLGGPNSKTRVYANQSVAMAANNPNLHSRYESRIERIEYETGLADNRKVAWGRADYEAFIAENRIDFNWAVRTLVDEAHRILSTPHGRARWDAAYDAIVSEHGARGNFREWYVYTMAVSDLLGIDYKKHFASRVEYEPPMDEEAEKRSWIVQRLIERGATSDSGAVTAGSLLPTEVEKAFKGGSLAKSCPFDSAEAMSGYLRNHAGGKSGTDADGSPWLIRMSKSKKINKRATWLVLKSK